MTSADLDTALGFTLSDRNARGRLVRLGGSVETILAAHAYPPPIEKLLAEALVVTGLLGATLKDAGGQLTLQAQTENGVVELLVCDYKAGQLRGYVKFDEQRLAEQGTDPTLFALFGKGYLAITFDQAVSGERYQGIVPLEGDSLCKAVEYYFCQSEQIPSFVAAGYRREPGKAPVAAGMLLQHLPEGEEGRERLHVRLDHPEWEEVLALAETLASGELTDTTLPLSDIVWRLFHDEGEIRVTQPTPLSRGCRCDPDHIRDVVSRFPEQERTEMADDSGVISVDCAFCARIFPISLESVGAGLAR